MNTATNLIDITHATDAELAALLGMTDDDDDEEILPFGCYRYTITGRTYHLRDEFKRLYGTWNPIEKSWTVIGSLLDSDVWRWRRMGCQVEISD